MIHSVKIDIKNRSLSSITYWVGYGDKNIKLPPSMASPLGYTVKTGETITAFKNNDLALHQYWLAIAYWVGSDAKIPAQFRYALLPGWRLTEANKGWFKVQSVCTYVFTQSGNPTAEIVGALGPCDCTR